MTRDVAVTAIDSVPVITNIDRRVLRHRHHRGPSVVAPTLTLTVANTTTLSGATVSIGNFHAGQDVLAFTKVGNITGTFNSTTGTLTLTGSDTVANYQQVLRSVTFDSDGSRIRGTRDISFEVSNGTTNSIEVDRKVRVRR